jgi:UDP-N-acetyl-2-amino-2-deoxyglucuronate dehydrogenase
VDGKEFEFSDGFTDLHTLSYKEIIEGRGFCIDDAKPSIEAVYEIRNSSPIGLKRISPIFDKTEIKLK